MDYRLCIMLFLLLSVNLVQCTPTRQSERSSKKKGSPVKLSENISENPFLRDHFTSTIAPVAQYQGNPFLTNTPKPHVSQDDNQYHDLPSRTGPQYAEENQVVTVGVYIHNPFLQFGNNIANTSANINTPLTNGDQGSNVVSQSPVSDSPSIIPNIGSSKRSKSDLMCEQYARQFVDRTEVIPLVGTSFETMNVSTNDCEKVHTLVVGGTQAFPGEYPHMVALGISNPAGLFTFFCGGTLISPNWVLTAAHCTYGASGSPTTAWMGTNNVNNNRNGISVNIKRIIRHPNYKPPAMYADIALINLETAVNFSSTIKPACLYQLYDMVPNRAWVTGWGVTEFAGDQSEELQKAFLEIVDNIACTRRHNNSRAVPYGITPSMICAGDRSGGWKKDSCQGDSGGPLQVTHPEYSCFHQVIGITSFGEGCAIIDTPGVYTRVSHYLNWIEKYVWPDV